MEEIAFRGVLYGLVRRDRGAVWATAVSSVLFGLWHVPPSLHPATAKPAVGSVVGQSGPGAALAVLGAVLFTAAAGVLFCELRRRSGSLLAVAVRYAGGEGQVGRAIRRGRPGRAVVGRPRGVGARSLKWVPSPVRRPVKRREVVP
ncbi:CPBP family intramembrane metalloprotease [Streptomyces sp. NBC_01343]|uniref:CPBP family intramembrane glutamic endopeptidase n=1 Tax=Streptomyces sp. NBC_01343 TaxID=2903832 RepID=UPI002E160B46|nr:CPBP family intramembrane metalloprotease [Streptomyces sp. NBC_01343]